MKNSTITEYKLHPEFADRSADFDKAEELYVKGDHLYIKLPTTPEWCTPCNGTGRRSEWDVNGYDIDAMLEDDEDGERREAYFNGYTDITCDVCKGDKVFAIVDQDALNEVQKAIFETDGELHDQDYQQEREDEQTLYWESGGASGRR